MKINFVNKQEWFNNSLIKYKEAREKELAKDYYFSSNELIRRFVTLEADIINYMYTLENHEIIEPEADQHWTVDNCLSSNIMNDWSGEIDLKSPAYLKYIEPFMPTD